MTHSSVTCGAECFLHALFSTSKNVAESQSEATIRNGIALLQCINAFILRRRGIRLTKQSLILFKRG